MKKIVPSKYSAETTAPKRQRKINFDESAVNYLNSLGYTTLSRTELLQLVFVITKRQFRNQHQVRVLEKEVKNWQAESRNNFNKYVKWRSYVEKILPTVKRLCSTVLKMEKDVKSPL